MNYALRPYVLAALLALGSAVVTIAVAAHYDLPLRDPDGIAGPAYLRLPGAVALFVLLDVVPRWIHRRGQLRQILRERYGPGRMALVGLAVAGAALQNLPLWPAASWSELRARLW